MVESWDIKADRMKSTNKIEISSFMRALSLSLSPYSRNGRALKLLLQQIPVQFNQNKFQQSP